MTVKTTALVVAASAALGIVSWWLVTADPGPERAGAVERAADPAPAAAAAAPKAGDTSGPAAPEEPSATLTVRDEGDALDVRFGWISLFGRRIAWDQITAVQRARSKVIDGWGIHYIPGRGTTWNLWGFDCVELTVGGKTLRIGSDDADTLAAYVSARLGPS